MTEEEVFNKIREILVEEFELEADAVTMQSLLYQAL
jgi:acyl carrier protein